MSFKTPTMMLQVLLLVLCQLCSTAAFATVSAYLDHNPVGLDTSFTLTFEITGDAGTPDFNPISTQFDILNRQQSSNISIVNGSFNRKQQWQLSLMPKKAGHFVIPSISFGQQSSQRISIDVVEEQSFSASNRDIFIEAKVDTSRPYIQQQVLLYVKLYRAVNIGKATLNDPEHHNLIIKKLGDDRHGETKLNARRYLIVERLYALYPQQSGDITLPAISFEGQVMQYNGQLKTRRVRSEPITLHVQPIPNHISKDWLPVSHLEIAEAWPNTPPELEVGQALTRTIELRAHGASSAQLPEIMTVPSPYIKAYPDKAKLDDDVSNNGIIGSRIQSIALVANKAGVVHLPAIEIPWWNTQTQKSEIARLPARRILIRAAPIPTQPTTTVSPPQNIKTPPPIKERIQKITDPFWIYSTEFIFSLWMLTLILWWYTHRKRHQIQTNDTTQTSKKDALKTLQLACNQHDAKACRTALLQWAKVTLPSKNIHSLGMLRQYLNIDAQNSVQDLESALFSAQNNHWDAQQLFHHITKSDTHPQVDEEHIYSVRKL